jgi:hypothetical protein
VAVLWLVGSLVGNGDENPTSAGGSTTSRTERPAGAETTARHPRTTATATTARASVKLVPTGTVYVCLVDGGGRVLIPGSQFEAGQQVPVYRARKLRLTLGNNAVQMRVNGRALAVPASATAIAYEITPAGARTLPADQAPTCT